MERKRDTAISRGRWRGKALLSMGHFKRYHRGTICHENGFYFEDAWGIKTKYYLLMTVASSEERM